MATKKTPATVVGRQDLTRHLAKQAGLTLKKAGEVLEATLDHILKSLDELEKRPLPGPAPDLTPYARKGDNVTVSAKLPFLGSVVAHGTIDK